MMNYFVMAEYERKGAAFVGMVVVMSGLAGIVTGKVYEAFRPLMTVRDLKEALKYGGG